MQADHAKKVSLSLEFRRSVLQVEDDDIPEEETKTKMKERIQSMPHDELLVRKEYITARLEDVTIYGRMKTMQQHKELEEQLQFQLQAAALEKAQSFVAAPGEEGPSSVNEESEGVEDEFSHGESGENEDDQGESVDNEDVIGEDKAQEGGEGEASSTEPLNTGAQEDALIQSADNVSALSPDITGEVVTASSPMPSTSPLPPIFIPKKPPDDTHWDLVLKELMWLSTDFQSERKRQVAQGKKLSMAIRQHFRSEEQKRQQKAAMEELNLRKRAAKMAREVTKQFWHKIERVIAHKQKLTADQERQASMDTHLMNLIRKTEEYGNNLHDHPGGGDNTGLGEDSSSSGDSGTDEENGGDGGSFPHKKQRSIKHVATSIEEVLQGEIHSVNEASANALNSPSKSSRLARKLHTDYRTVKITTQERRVGLYGEATTDESEADDGEYEFNQDEEEVKDDLTTLLEAEQNLQQTELDEELSQLQKESDMDVEQLRALYYGGSTSKHERPSDQDKKKQAKNEQTQSKPGNTSSGSDADDDGDLSDVEDYLTVDGDDKSLSSGEFRLSDNDEALAVDDETTLIEEESQGRDMTYADEIALLQQENDMSVEELRQNYGSVLGALVPATLSLKNGSHDQSPRYASSARPVPSPAQEPAPCVAPAGNLDDVSSNDDDDNDNCLVVESAKSRRAMPSSGSVRPSRRTGEDEAMAKTAALGLYADTTDLASASDLEGDGEFVANNKGAVDDETTLIEEERLGRDISYADEIALLQRENDMSLEELRAMYATNAVASSGAEKTNDESSVMSTSVASASVMSHGSDEFAFDAQDAVDDETTLIEEECRGRDMSYADEISQLQRENEMAVEELRAMYANPVADAETSSAADNADLDHHSSGSDEFVANANDMIDDETTLLQEERLGRDMSYDDEIALLNKENDMSVEELRALYAGANAGSIKVAAAAQTGRKRPSRSSSSSDVDSDATPRLRRSRRQKRRANTDLDSEKDDDSGENNKKTKSGNNQVDDALHTLQEKDRLARETNVTRPFLLSSWVKLREYQQIGLNWLTSLQARRLNGILADEMGLGKTLQTIAMLAYLASYKGIWGPHLIVVPTSCMVNWETELKRFCPAFKVLCYYGSAKRRRELRQGWTRVSRKQCSI
jgi:hypothetical protein